MVCPKCRAALPAGSRFCNSCGSALGAAQAQPQPTQAYRPPVAPPQAAPRPPVYNPAAAAYAPPAPAPAAAPNRKPVLLLVSLILLITAGVAAAAFKLVKRPGPSVVSGIGAPAATAPNVSHAVTPDAPPSPGVVAAQGGAPPPGHPVTGSQPKPDDMAPSPVMVQGGGAPNSPSVTRVLTPEVPAYPNPVAVTPARTPAGDPMRVTQRQVTPGRPLETRQPAPPDNRDFDKYILWLRFVENQRVALRAQGETETFRVIQGFYQTMIGMSDPDFDERQFDRGLQMTLNRTLIAMRSFRNNILRTKPPVPADCKALDQYYMAAVGDEAMTTARLLQAMVNKDIGSVKAVGKSGTANIDWNLGQANQHLERVYQGRGLNQQFRIQTGGSSSMLGGLVGLGGL
jgi:hypothetical protein